MTFSKELEAPDLENGYIISNYSGVNRWKTPIETALLRIGNDGEKLAYLSHENRAARGGSDPFDKKDYEVVRVSAWSGEYFLRAGSSLFRNPTFGMTRTTQTSLVQSDNRKIQILDFESVLSILQRDEFDPHKHFFAELSYYNHGFKYILYMPCRHISFPNPSSTSEKYLQPISGYVLYEEKEIFYCAYVAVQIIRNNTVSISFRLSEQVNFFQTINTIPSLKRNLAIKILPKFLMTRGFCRVIRFSEDNIGCRFYYYE